MPMNTASAELDARFSEPGAVATTWDETRQVLETAELFWISTVRADGRPHVTPVGGAGGDGAVGFPTGTDEQKYLNLSATPQVVLTTGCNSWDHGLDVVVEGEARHVTDQTALERAAKAFAVKWQGGRQFAVGE